MVDDEKFMRQLLREALEVAGYVVREATSGTEAIEMVRQAPPDALLLDIIMPEMDGFATCGALRDLPEGRDLPILMVTGLEDADTINRSYAVGATDYVTKPINDSHLRHHLRYILRSSRLFHDLRRKEIRLSFAQRIAHLGNWEWIREQQLVRCSAEALRILGFDNSRSKIEFADFLARIHDEDRPVLEEALDGCLSAGEAFSLDHRIVLPDGRLRHLHTQGECRQGPGGKRLRPTGTIQDISERKELEEKLLLSGKVFDNSSEMILITDVEGDMIDVNPAFCRLTGYSRLEAIGSNIRTPRSSQHGQQFFDSLWDSLRQAGQWQGELWHRRKNGESFPCLMSINAVRNDEGEITHFVATGTDISKLKETEKRLQYLANFDPLTDLPNRLLFFDRLQQALIYADRGNDRIGLLFFDLDNFKEINDTLGHQSGDQVLQMVAGRVMRCVRKSDTVARLGSDEFGLVLRELADTHNGAQVAQRLMEVLGRPFILGDREFFLTVSIGIALFPEDGTEPEELEKKAETAMYFAKREGKNRYQFFSGEMNTRAQERLAIKTGLYHALERQEFFLHYQPKFDSHSGELTGLEALARWQPPDGELIPPLKFIPMAEESGLIIPLGEMVLRLACEQNRQWQERGFSPFRVAVNLSAHQFRQGDLVETVRRVLEDTRLEPRWLELEITESAMMQDTGRTIETLRTLKEMGITIALDDFGTGYSSLSYLKRFPLDTLKIDYSFIKNMFVNAEDAAIVKAVIAMARSLKLRIVAEGVETEEQRVFLREQGCDEVQGYQAGMPRSATEVEIYLPFKQEAG